MSSVVITNAGPLIALAKLNLLHLLKQLYARVQFPVSVYEEVVVEGVRFASPFDPDFKLEEWVA